MLFFVLIIIVGILGIVINAIQSKINEASKKHCDYHHWVYRATYKPEYKAERFVCDSCGYEPVYEARNNEE